MDVGEWRPQQYEPNRTEKCAAPANDYRHMPPWNRKDGWCPLCGQFGISEPSIWYGLHVAQAENKAAQERIVALEAENEALRELLKEWRNEMWPFCEDGWIEGLSRQPMKAQLDWFERGGDGDGNMFNERRLYKALGKEDARSVLGIWRRFRFIAEHLRAALEKP